MQSGILTIFSGQDKDAKIAYLEKIHLYVQAAKGSEVHLKLGKVDNTNVVYL